MDSKYTVAGVGMAQSSRPVTLQNQLGGAPFEAAVSNTTLLVEE
jgi:hypothetical protein